MDLFGIGLDIGTTTVQAELVNLNTGESVETVCVLNAQRSFGADVISRIGAACNGKLDELFTAINNQVENIIRQFIRNQNLPGIEQCTVSGNTTMLHLFCRADPSAMGYSPYTPKFLKEQNFTGKELSLSARRIALLPGISAFVGADIVSGLAFIDILNKKEYSLFVDIGTNGEIAVWKNGEEPLLCCSTAAGPCFEEAEISCGLNAVNFIDTIAAMKRQGLIDKTGALADEFAQTGFRITEGIITQNGVRQFQLAKAAVYSGIKFLCKTAGLKLENINTAYIAGRLGFFLNLDSAAETGLFPRELTKKAAVCGNTSLKGVVKSLTDPSFLPRCREIIDHSSTVDIAGDKYFAAAFVHNMSF
jgi:uncharacterized 2Fe-2S/4Fe-4S cluster protein (DUF4445 family)